MTIRVADARDARAIARVRAEARRAAYGSFLSPAKLDDPEVEASDARWYERGLSRQRERSRIDVAERAGEIVGYCAFGAGQFGGWPGGWVFDLFVAPHQWRAGVGTELLGSAIGFLRERGCAEAALLVFEANERGRAFYEALGWQADGYREVSQEDGGAAVLRYRVALLDTPSGTGR